MDAHNSHYSHVEGGPNGNHQHQSPFRTVLNGARYLIFFVGEFNFENSRRESGQRERAPIQDSGSLVAQTAVLNPLRLFNYSNLLWALFHTSAARYEVRLGQVSVYSILNGFISFVTTLSHLIWHLNFSQHQTADLWDQQRRFCLHPSGSLHTCFYGHSRWCFATYSQRDAFRRCWFDCRRQSDLNFHFMAVSFHSRSWNFHPHS